MKIMISGHRKSKLKSYSEDWIRLALEETINKIPEFLFDGKEIHDKFIGLSGMADGIDLWFCEILDFKNLDYWAYIPFETQNEYMSDEDKHLRESLIARARLIKKVRNSQMVEDCDEAIVVWDGNKGGTHNVFQQLVEKKKPFYWLNPVKEVIIEC